MSGLVWERCDRGWYEAVDSEGTRWRIVQRTSSAWSIFDLGGVDYGEQGSLADAKAEVADRVRERVDPEYAAKRRAQRAKRKPAEPSRESGGSQ